MQALRVSKRPPNLLQWLRAKKPYLVCLQEVSCADGEFSGRCNPEGIGFRSPHFRLAKRATPHLCPSNGRRFATSDSRKNRGVAMSRRGGASPYLSTDIIDLEHARDQRWTTSLGTVDAIPAPRSVTPGPQSNGSWPQAPRGAIFASSCAARHTRRCSVRCMHSAIPAQMRTTT